MRRDQPPQERVFGGAFKSRQLLFLFLRFSFWRRILILVRFDAIVYYTAERFSIWDQCLDRNDRALIA